MNSLPESTCTSIGQSCAAGIGTRAMALLLLASILPLLPACRPDVPLIPAPAALQLVVSHTWNGQTPKIDSVYSLNGHTVQLYCWNYMFSQLQLQDSAGQLHTLAVDPRVGEGLKGTWSLSLNDLPEGRYTGVRFVIGLDSATNHRDPTTLPDGHPLSRFDMHWSWNTAAGYKFLKVETDLDGSGSSFNGILYHIAGDNNLMQVVLPLNTPLEIRKGKTAQLKLEANLPALWNGILLPQEAITMSDPSDKFVDRIKANATALWTAGVE